MKTSTKKYNKSLCAEGNSKELEKIRDFIQFWSLYFGFNEVDTNKIILAVDEVCTNLINHAIKLDKSKEICIEVEHKKNDFIISISDDASPFDLTTKNNIDMSEYFANFRRGGLGIQIVRHVMDEISYSPSDKSNPRNILQLRKHLV